MGNGQTKIFCNTRAVIVFVLMGIVYNKVCHFSNAIENYYFKFIHSIQRLSGCAAAPVTRVERDLDADRLSWMLAQKLTRIQHIVIRHTLFVPRSSRLYSPILLRAISMANPAVSLSQPAQQAAALTSSHSESAPKSKENKDKKPKVVDGDTHPLEVRFVHPNRVAVLIS